MSETTIFHCDYCGTPEVEEPAGYARPHCTIEVALRGRRFKSSNGVVLSESPPGPDSSLNEQLWGGDQRWSMALCDRCTRRIAGLLDMRLETEAEYQAKLDELAKNVARAQMGVQGIEPGSSYDTLGGTRGRMTAQYPTPVSVVPEKSISESKPKAPKSRRSSK